METEESRRVFLNHALTWGVFSGPAGAALTQGNGMTNPVRAGNAITVHGIVNLKDPAYGAKGDGVTNDATAIQAAIDAAFAIGAILFFPPGIYFIGTTTLIFKNNVKYIGSGKHQTATKGTVIAYSGTSDAIRITNPINSSTSANIHIQDLSVHCGTPTAGKACIADVGSTFLTLERVQVSGNKYGIIFDQTEIASCVDCDFELVGRGKTAGLWLVSGAEHTVGGSAGFTNRITVEKCQFNGTDGIGIADDGGSNHVFRENNFNALATQIRVCATNGLKISDNEMESPITTCIQFATTKHGGGASGGSNVVTVDTNFMFSGAAIALVTLSANSISNFTAFDNIFANNHAAGTPFSGLAAGAAVYMGWGNKQNNTRGNSDIALGNKLNISGTWTPALKFGGGASGMTYGTQKGFWHVNGNTLLFDLTIMLTAKGSSTGTVVITGLPQVLIGTSGYNHAGACHAVNMAGMASPPIFNIGAGATSIDLFQFAANSDIALTDANFTNTTRLVISGQYQITNAAIG